MTYLYGFELEGFYKSGVEIPPTGYPTDGFPGLVELRTVGGSDIREAWSYILKQMLETPNTDFKMYSHTFTPEQRGKLRRRWVEKSQADIRNIYGKNPRSLGNRTIASLQINISNRLSVGFTNKDGAKYPDRYGLLDIPRIVRALDTEFSEEISLAGRQPGEYAVKDGIRLEYRSLPNFVFEADPVKARPFLDRVVNAVEQD